MIYSLVHIFGIIIKTQVVVVVWTYILVLCPILLMHVSIFFFLPIPWSCFVVVVFLFVALQLIWNQVKHTYCSMLFVQGCFGYIWSFVFLYNFLDFFLFVKNDPTLLIRIVLNLEIAHGWMATFAVLILLIHECGGSFHLPVSSSVSWFWSLFIVEAFCFLGRLISKCFILIYVAIVNEIISLISLLIYLLLVYRKATNSVCWFCILKLCWKSLSARGVFRWNLHGLFCIEICLKIGTLIFSYL